MELKDFISNTISQITDGLIESNRYILEKSPGSEGVKDQYRKIFFDIAVTTNEGEKDKIGGSVSVAQFFKVGGSTESSIATLNSNRIQFDVYIHILTG